MAVEIVNTKVVGILARKGLSWFVQQMKILDISES